MMPAARLLFAGAVAAAAALAVPIAAATPAGAGAGAALEQEAGPPWRQFLVRRTPGGAVDPRFGADGRVALGTLAARKVVADRMGRYVVVGSNAGGAPALARFLPNGQPDPAWRPDGPARPQANAAAVDAVALADGRTLVLGQLHDAGGRAVLWLVDTAGRAESRWLLLTGRPTSEALSIAPVRDTGNVMIATKSGDTLEAYIYGAPGAQSLPERLVRQKLPDGWSHAPVLVQTDRGWRWVDEAQPALEPLRVVAADDAERPMWGWQAMPVHAARAPAPQPPGAKAPAADGGALFNPLAAPRAPLPQPRSEKAWYLEVGGADLTFATAALLLAGFIVVRLFRSAWA